MNDNKAETTKSYDTIRLGIDAHSKWYYVARQIVAAGRESTGLQNTDLAGRPKNDERKALIAHILMNRTSVPQKWIVERLAMGSAPYLSRLAKGMGQRIASGGRTMRRLKKAILARVIT